MTTRLTLGPLLYYWSGNDWRDFYFRIADEAPVSSVCLGEIVCAKRAPLIRPHAETVIARLRAAGKEIVYSTPIVITDERDMALVLDAARDARTLVEANDVAALALLEGRPHAIGPFVNVYNESTLVRLTAAGARRITVPFELARDAIGYLAAAATDTEIEVQVFGRWPLAISARCYHARIHGRGKDACLFACGEDPDGLAVATMDGQPFLAVNGVQTLSHAYGCLLRELATLKAFGVARFRLSPQRVDMVRVARLFRDAADERLDPEDAYDAIKRLVSPAPLSNGFFHGREGVRVV